jgi:hypothetical protein
MQAGWLWERQHEDRNDQHLKQDIRSYVKDLQDMLEVQVTTW